MWLLLSWWFLLWFLIRLMELSFGWDWSDLVWVFVYLLATGFSVYKYKEAKAQYE